MLGRGITAAAGLFILAILAFPDPVAAQSLNLDFGEGGSATGRIVQIVVLMAILSLAPSILIMVTSFVRIIVVLSFLRTAMGAQQTPPNAVLISLALFMTFFIMQPTLETAYEDGVAPLIAEEISEEVALDRTVAPFRAFMLKHVRQKDLELFIELARIESVPSAAETPLRALIPAFMISELRRAFEIGFLLFVPFLMIDIVIASVLMSMGMLMLPPVLISLPFKLIFFVLVDGWYLVAGSLTQSFGPL